MKILLLVVQFHYSTLVGWTQPQKLSIKYWRNSVAAQRLESLVENVFEELSAIRATKAWGASRMTPHC